MSKPLAATTLAELLPSSIASDPAMSAAARAVESLLDDTQAAIDFIELYSRIDELPEPVLHLLAWENRVAGIEWTLARTLQDRRNLVKNSFELNKRRGTRWAVERVFSLLRLTAEITEWWEEGGDPYTFRVSLLDVSDRGILTEELALLEQLVDAYKPLTRRLTGVNLGLSVPPVEAYVGCAALLSVKVTAPVAAF